MDLEFHSCFPDDHTKFQYFVSALADTKIRTSKINFVLSKDDFVDKPMERLEHEIEPVKQCLSTGFVRKKKMEGGVTYSGGVLNNRIHGFGSKLQSDGDIYEGFFQNGIDHGYQQINYGNGIKSYFCSFGDMHGLCMLDVGAVPEYSLYEFNNKLKVFTEEEAERINNGDTFWYQYFTQEDSLNRLFGSQTFETPIEFKVAKEEVQFRLECVEPEAPRLNPFLEMILGNNKSKNQYEIKDGAIPPDFLTEAGYKYFSELKKKYCVTEMVEEQKKPTVEPKPKKKKKYDSDEDSGEGEESEDEDENEEEVQSDPKKPHNYPEKLLYLFTNFTVTIQENKDDDD